VTDGHITGAPPAGFFGAITVRVTATDPSGRAVTNEFNIDVLQATNNAPKLGAAANVQVNEFTTVAVDPALDNVTLAGTVAATLTATDQLTAFQKLSPPGPLTWSITNADALTNSLFELGAAAELNAAGVVTSTEALKFKSGPAGSPNSIFDFEQIKAQIAAAPNPSAYSINGTGTEITFNVGIQVTDSDGVTATQTEIVRIENVNEKAAGSIHASAPNQTGGNNIILTATNTITDPDLVTAVNPTGAATTQWQTWNGTNWVNIATGATFTASNQTVRAVATDVDPFATPPVVAPEIFVVGTGANNSGVGALSGAVPAGLFANGVHNRTFLGLNGTDEVTYVTDTLGVTVNLTNVANNTGIAAGDKYVDVENFTGGSGSDTFVALADNVGNIFNGGNGVDTIDYSAVGAGSRLTVTINSSSTQQVTGNGGFTTDQILGIENFFGGQGGNIITVNDAAAHNLKGGAGADTITGGANSSDTVIATVDNVRDTYNGGTGTGVDAADYSAYTTGLSVNLSINGGVVTGSGSTATSSDTLTGFENFAGGSGSDNITGTGGANRLTGGAGNDTMTGGAGVDTFVFNSGFGNDHITDFTAGTVAGHDLADLSLGLVSDVVGLTAVGFAGANGDALFSDFMLKHATNVAASGGVAAHVQLHFGNPAATTIDLDNVTTLAKEDFLFH